MSFEVSVTELWLYPVKSLAGIRVDVLYFDDCGPVGDRRWMLVDERGRFVSQRSLSVMALFKLSLIDGQIQILSPTGRSLTLPTPDSAKAYPKRVVTVWNDELTGYEVDVAASEWFSVEMKVPLHLVWIGNASDRRIPDAQAYGTERVGFADGYPLLVCNQASLDRLNEASDSPLEQRRFRPNVVIDGLPAGLELALGNWHLGQGSLALLKVCERCNIPAIEPDTATYQKETAALIKSECRYQGHTVFGVNAVARGLNSLRPGESGPWYPAA
jgi:uncharacterized protein YcbX